MDIQDYGDYPDLSKVNRILVLALRHIGDVLLTTPVYRLLKRRLPQARVDALVNSGTEPMLSGNPDIDEVWVIDRARQRTGFRARIRSELQMLGLIRRQRYDMTIGLTTGDRVELFSFISGAPIRVGAGRKKVLGRPLFNVVVNHAPAGRHYVERHLDCLRRIGLFPAADDKKLVLYEGESDRMAADAALRERGVGEQDRFIVVHCTSRWMFKTLPVALFAQMVNRIGLETGLPVVLTAGPEKIEMSYLAAARRSLSDAVVDLSGRLTLKQLAAVIRRADVFVGVDSAPMHMAAAVGTPVVALFGPTSEQDWGPWGAGHIVVSSSEHPCRPCQRDGCGGSKRSECLENVDLEFVVAAVRRRLAASKGTVGNTVAE